jgi:outer membrane immunogenic protein
MPTMLLYGTAGLAYGGAYAQVTQSAYQAGNFGGMTFTGGGSTNQLLTGWTAGGGLEWMFMQNWSLKGEANYFDLGNMNVSTVAYSPTIDPGSSFLNNSVAWGRTQVNYQGVIARVGINYHFNLGTVPVVAGF